MQGLSVRTRAAAKEALAGRRRGLRALLPFMGPALIASVAYMDPGNFATNIQGGAEYGYKLLWVVVFANLTAMLFQSLSAKLGITTGKNLAELCRDRFARPVVMGMWGISEVAAMATDLAELLGAALGLNLLFHIPLLWGAGIAAVATYGILSLQRHGFRPIEAFIGVLVGVMAASYLAETFFARPDWGSVLQGALVPNLADSGAVLLAVGIVGATVMPHAIYLHSGLTQDRVVAENVGDRRKILHFSNIDVLAALTLAGLVNLAMMYMAASTFHLHHAGVSDITTVNLAHHRLPDTDAAFGRRGGSRLLGLPARLGSGQLGGGDDGGPGHHAGLREAADPALGAAGGDHGADPGSYSHRCQRDPGPDCESGGAELCSAGASDRPGDVHFQPGSDGGPSQWPADFGGGDCLLGSNTRDERGSALADAGRAFAIHRLGGQRAKSEFRAASWGYRVG